MPHRDPLGLSTWPLDHIGRDLTLAMIRGPVALKLSRNKFLEQDFKTTRTLKAQSYSRRRKRAEPRLHATKRRLRVEMIGQARE